MDERTPALQVTDLTKTFPGVQALVDVSFAAYAGEVHTLLGENGAGKSTLLKTVFGVQRPDSGEIRVDGTPVSFTRPSEAMAVGIAMVHQELSLVPQLTAIQNLVLGREQTRGGVIDWREARQRARASLARLRFDAPDDVPGAPRRGGPPPPGARPPAGSPPPRPDRNEGPPAARRRRP